MKKLNKKGFTLMEMLIVIAIIAILIAIAIPTFMSQLEKAHERTDLANARSLKSLAATKFLSDELTFAEGEDEVTIYLAEDGQSTSDSEGIEYTSTKYGKGTAISATVDKNGMVEVNCADIAGGVAGEGAEEGEGG